jgi:hypothetical protein
MLLEWHRAMPDISVTGAAHAPAARTGSPITQCESSDARNTATGAMFSGSPKRPSGVPAGLFAEFASEMPRWQAFDVARHDRVHPNAARAQFTRQRKCKRIGWEVVQMPTISNNPRLVDLAPDLVGIGIGWVIVALRAMLWRHLPPAGYRQNAGRE